MKLRESTNSCQCGDTQRLLGMRVRRSKEEIEAERAATQLKKVNKEQAKKDKVAKKVTAIQEVSQLQNQLAKDNAAVEDAHPCHLKGTYPESNNCQWVESCCLPCPHVDLEDEDEDEGEATVTELTPKPKEKGRSRALCRVDTEPALDDVPTKRKQLSSEFYHWHTESY